MVSARTEAFEDTGDDGENKYDIEDGGDDDDGENGDKDDFENIG